MISQKAAFKLYFGIGLHFKLHDYSMLKYGSNTIAADLKWSKQTQEQRYRFAYLADKLGDIQNMVYACIACEFADIRLAFDSKEDVLRTYYAFRAKREGIEYLLNSEYQKWQDSGMPTGELLIKKYLMGVYSPEFMLCMEQAGHTKIQTMYDDKNMSWARPKLLKVLKYRAFFNPIKYVSIFHANDETATI
jgi:hypothetical protein